MSPASLSRVLGKQEPEPAAWELRFGYFEIEYGKKAFIFLQEIRLAYQKPY